MQNKQQRQLYKRQNRIYQNNLIGLMFIIPSLLGVVIFVLIPFFDSIRRSFYNAMGNEFKGIENYKEVLQNEAFKQAVYNTARFTLVCIPLLIIISLILALFLHSAKIKTKIFKTTYLIPMAIPVASVVLIWKMFFHSNGFLNVIIKYFGFASVDWINTDKAFFVLVFSYIWKNIGYDIILWLAGLSAIPKSLYESAQIDGANSFQIFIYITLPNIIPTLFIISVLSLLNSFKVFREAYLVAGNYPHTSIYMIQHLFNNWFLSLDIQKLCAASVMISAVIFIVILILQKFWGSENI